MIYCLLKLLIKIAFEPNRRDQRCESDALDLASTPIKNKARINELQVSQQREVHYLTGIACPFDSFQQRLQTFSKLSDEVTKDGSSKESKVNALPQSSSFDAIVFDKLYLSGFFSRWPGNQYELTDELKSRISSQEKGRLVSAPPTGVEGKRKQRFQDTKSVVIADRDYVL